MKTHLRTLFSASKKYGFIIALITTVAIGVSAQTNTFPLDGNAGIGTTAPTQKLQVDGVGLFTGSSVSGNTAAGLYVFDQNIFSLNGSNARDLNVGGLNLKFFTGTTYVEKIRIDLNGNLGIGTTNPDNPLTVRASGSNTLGFMLKNYALTQNLSYIGPRGSGGTAQNQGFLALLNQGSTTVGLDSAGPSYFTGGNLGIGTTNPGSLLQLEGPSRPTVTINNTAGTTKMRLTTAVLNWAGMTHNANFDGTNWNLDDTSLAGWINKLDSRSGVDVAAIAHLTPGTNPRAYTELFTVLGSGKVGIGAPNPAYKLDVSGEIRSSTGGFRFPDGSVQTTAATGSQWANGSSNINYTSGNVGIGTTAPGAKLEVDGSGVIRVTEGTRGVPTSGAGLELSANSTGSFVGAYNRSTSSYRRLYFYGSPYVFEGGNVGIGIENPQNKLHVGGSITVDGNINAKYQDLAEWVPSSEQLSAGTVVVLDTTKSNQVTSSSVSYDTRVAGVISAQPGITLGESGEGKVLVATTGRVRVKVDASRGAIQIGDLLVTSDVSGVAMKSEAIEFAGRKMHMPGTIIGKALEPLAKGTGEILVLLSLQ